MNDPGTLLRDLRSYISLLESKYINQYIPTNPLITPDVFEFDVRSFCILSHACIEEYYENLCLFILDRTVAAFLNNKYARPLISLFNYSRHKIKIENNETKNEIRSFDNLRDVLNLIKTEYSNLIHDNHGISLKYLRTMLYPLAVDIPDDIKLKESLKKLADFRGEVAHTRMSKKVLSPEDARNIVNDCIDLCELIKNHAETLLA